VPTGSVCDVIQSRVDIFYRSGGADPTEENEEDMKNLLVETILSQADAGAFGDLGSVGSVEVEGKMEGTSNSGGVVSGGGWLISLLLQVLTVASLLAT
jgi:hypothetical protein